MEKLDNLNVNEFISNTLIDVFDTMVSMEVAPTKMDPEKFVGHDLIVGSVGFAGKVLGNINLLLTYDFARIITAKILGMEEDEIEGDEEVNDVLGELSNMIGGDMKSRLCDAGFPCELTIPSITSGKQFKIESKGWARHESLTFKQENYMMLVEVYIRNSDS